MSLICGHWCEDKIWDLMYIQGCIYKRRETKLTELKRECTPIKLHTTHSPLLNLNTQNSTFAALL